MQFGADNLVSFYNVILTDPEADITYNVEHTTNLVDSPWSNSGWNLIATNTTDDVDFDQLEHRFDGSVKDQIFFRLRITPDS